jgi:hypothetical protein
MTPLNVIIHIGWITFFVTFLVSLYYLYQRVFLNVPQGYTSIILAIFFFGSLVILILGFIGKYLSNIYAEIRKRPLFHIDKTFNI